MPKLVARDTDVEQHGVRFRAIQVVDGRYVTCVDAPADLPDDECLIFRIARSENLPALLLVARQQAKPDDESEETIDDQEARWAHILAQRTFRSIENATWPDGEPIEDTVDSRARILRDREWGSVREYVLGKANQLEQEHRAAKARAEGNLLGSSSGNGSTATSRGTSDPGPTPRTPPSSDQPTPKRGKRGSRARSSPPN